MPLVPTDIQIAGHKFSRLTHKDSGEDLGLLVSDALDDALLKDHLTALVAAQQEDKRIQLMDAEEYGHLLDHAPEAIGEDWYALPCLRAFTEEDTCFKKRILRGLPLSVLVKIAEEGHSAEAAGREYVVDPKEVGLDCAMRSANCYDAPDGTRRFARENDPELKCFSENPLVKEYLGSAAAVVAKHISRLGNDAFYGGHTHKALANHLKTEKGKVLLWPVFVGPVGIDDIHYDNIFCYNGWSRLVVHDDAKK